MSILRKNKIVVKEFKDESGKTEMALLSFDGKVRDEIIARFNEQFLIEGDHIKNGGLSSPKTMLSLLCGGVGSVGMAGVASGQLFMATANPATLMQIGNGLGSAVMGSSGIVAQAPFIPVAGASMQVAPLIAFQALSTIQIMKQFEEVNKKLNLIQNTVNTIMQRNEATFVGEVISAANRIGELETQFSICNQFTEDMIVRLAILEDKVNPLFERYNYLYKSQNLDERTTPEQLNIKETDAYMAIVISILDIRIDLLKMKLNIQNNPGFIKDAANNFAEKIDVYQNLWTLIQNKASDIDAIAKKLKETVDEMNWWQKKMPSWMFGNRTQRKRLEKKSEIFEKEALKHQIQFDNIIDDAMELGDAVKKEIFSDRKMSLVYWRDEMGEHSYYTDDLLIENKA